MKVMTIAGAVLTFLALLTAMICGLWLRANGAAPADSVQFHMTFGIVAFAGSFVTLVSAIVWAARDKKRRAGR